MQRRNRIERIKELKFIHIPKTAGSSIENNALNKGITWGIHDSKLGSYYRGLSGTCFWHTPLRFLNKLRIRLLVNRYDFFAVVRNPYCRCLSEFHYFANNGVIDKIYTKDHLNYTICHYIKLGRDRDHWAPQSNFIYDTNGIQLVKNVLKFENLDYEFMALMTQYKLNVKLVTEFNVSPKHFTVDDLYPSTILAINKFYYSDFANFGYQIIDPESAKSHESTS